MIDYQEIIEQLDDEKVKMLLNKLEIPYDDQGGALIMPTVCHNEDIDTASRKLYYYKNTHVFYCYTEDGAMSIFTFLKRYYETRSIEYDWFQDILNVILDCSNMRQFDAEDKGYKSIIDNYTQKKTRQELPYYSDNLLQVFIKHYPIEWLNDSISKAAMDKFNIRFAPVENKIIIPHYDANNHLIGIRGRALNTWEIENIGKYMPIQIEGKWYSHPLSLNLYGLNITKENIKKTGIAYLVEAEKSVLQMESFSIPNCAAAVCGSKLNKYALDILIRECHPQEIVICFDNEELPGSTEYFDKLYSLCSKYTAYSNFSFIYDKEHLLRLKDSPTDKGEETFQKLLRKRVRI